MVFCAAQCLIQILYAILVGFYPFNSFISSLFCPLGAIVLTCKYL